LIDGEREHVAIDDHDSARVLDAARNNAELCDIVSRAHGVVGEMVPDAWTASRRTPPYYPDAVTLAPSTTAADVLARIDSGPGASVKDSFATLDLASDGFRVLFAAEWIGLDARPERGADDLGIRWSTVSDADALSAWEAAWSEDGVARGQFPATLIEHPDLVILGGRIDGALVAGVILNRSARVVGVSNLFFAGDLDAVWPSCLDEIGARFPGLAVVGYESGVALDAAVAAGFRSLGPLRVWIKG
jgi:hypothetical protein